MHSNGIVTTMAISKILTDKWQHHNTLLFDTLQIIRIENIAVTRSDLRTYILFKCRWFCIIE
jgi:hypothetical protein